MSGQSRIRVPEASIEELTPESGCFHSNGTFTPQLCLGAPELGCISAELGCLRLDSGCYRYPPPRMVLYHSRIRV